MNLNNNVDKNIYIINNEINNKIKKVFNGITTKDLKKNIKELNNKIKYDYKQIGGLVNLYILKELNYINDNIIKPPTPLNFEDASNKLLEYLNKDIEDKEESGSQNEKIGYNKIKRKKLLWLIDDLNTLEVKNLDLENNETITKIKIIIKDIYNFLMK
jgi:hypothetical protein